MAVLAGWSSSDEGEAALRAAAREAALRSLPLAVCDLGARDDGGQGVRGAVAALARVATIAGVAGGAQVLRRPEHQDPADALLDAVPTVGAQVVVIGTRRRSPVGKFLLGSTAQRIILGAQVPVLVVKSDGPDAG